MHYLPPVQIFQGLFLISLVRILALSHQERPTWMDIFSSYTMILLYSDLQRLRTDMVTLAKIFVSEVSHHNRLFANTIRSARHCLPACMFLWKTCIILFQTLFTSCTYILMIIYIFHLSRSTYCNGNRIAAEILILSFQYSKHYKVTSMIF